MIVQNLTISILEKPQQLAQILKPQACIQTNAYVARKYGLNRERVRLGQKLTPCGDGAEYHELSDSDPTVVLEDYAEFCTLLCAIDGKGNMAMVHAPLLADTKNLLPYARGILPSFRKKVDALLSHPRKLVISGMNTAAAEMIMSHIHDVFSDVQDTIVQLSQDRLGNNAFPMKERNEKYMGMLFIPRMLAQNSQNVLLLLGTNLYRQEIATYLS